MKWPKTEDLLFVTYDPQKVDPEKMIKAIQTVKINQTDGFQAEIRKK